MWKIQASKYLIQDVAPEHTQKMLFADNNISVLNWTGNSAKLNSVENVCSHLKNEVQDAQATSILQLVDILNNTSINNDKKYFPYCISSFRNEKHCSLSEKNVQILKIWQLNQ